jgi:hypothetical protein
VTLWRCPHCGTPQPVAARCWVCKRSATSCGTCRHFRASVATRIGYCGLDRDRAPLAGDEIRGCWVAVPAIASEPETTTAPDRLLEFAPPRLILGFVPVESVAAVATDGEPVPATLAVASLPPTLVPSPTPADDGMLWSDLEA